LLRTLFISVYGILILISFPSCRQKVHEDATQIKSFFFQLDDSILAKKQFLLIDSIDNGNWWKDIFKRKIFDHELSIKDWYFIYGQMKDAKESVWTNKYFDSAKIVSVKYISGLAKPNALDDVPTNYSFSKPFFSKDGKYCVLFYDKYCGFLCAKTSLRLYKKDNGKWLFIKSFYTIMS